MLLTLGLAQPVHEPKTVDARKFAFVVGYKRATNGECMSGNNEVIPADRRTSSR